MNTIELKQKNQFAGISLLMAMVSLAFLLYVGSSLVNSTKQHRQQGSSIEVACQ